MLSGILLVDKPAGMSSNKVITIAKQKLGIKKIGHCGTLDPFASGLLILLINKATSLQSYFMDKDKTYQTEITFGQTTDTLDPTGRILPDSSPIPSLAAIKQCVKHNFLGVIKQSPPAFSAIHINGKRAYHLARSGQTFDIPTRQVSIHSFEIDSYSPPKLSCRITSSKGTYIRSIARDLARQLGGLGYASALKRIQSGGFSLDDSVSPEAIDLKHLKDLTAYLDKCNRIIIDPQDTYSLKNGHYDHLKSRLKRELNVLMLDNQCVAVINYHQRKYKLIYNCFS